MKNYFYTYLIALLIFCACSEGNATGIPTDDAEFSSNSVVEVDLNLQENMVIQQNSKFILSGKGTAYQSIRINCSWEGKDVFHTIKVAANGKWSQQINIPEGSFTLHTITVEGKEKKVFSNILIGEVWLCSGQSNMWYPLRMVENGQEDMLDAANYPNIRLLNMRQTQSATPVEEYQDRWQVCSTGSVEWFSAIGYHFGKKMLKELNVPIGLIDASWGDTTAEVWAERNAVLSNQEVRERALLNDKTPRADPNSPYKIGHAYNAMIYPLRNIPLAGVLWYQGESNMDYQDHYPSLLETLIESWRSLWRAEAKDMPFYIAQICPYKREFNFKTNYANPSMRFTQQIASEKIANSGVICNDDIGNINDIHPLNKHDVGLRFAYLALANKYKVKSFDNKKTPVFERYTINGNQIEISFKYAEEGLKTRDGKSPTLFEIAGVDKIFYPAEAVIDGNKISLTSANVSDPIAARLGWSYTKTSNLISNFGLPVSVFKTYNWVEEEEEK